MLLCVDLKILLGLMHNFASIFYFSRFILSKLFTHSFGLLAGWKHGLNESTIFLSISTVRFSHHGMLCILTRMRFVFLPKI